MLFRDSGYSSVTGEVYVSFCHFAQFRSLHIITIIVVDAVVAVDATSVITNMSFSTF